MDGFTGRRLLGAPSTTNVYVKKAESDKRGDHLIEIHQAKFILEWVKEGLSYGNSLSQILFGQGRWGLWRVILCFCEGHSL